MKSKKTSALLPLILLVALVLILACVVGYIVYLHEKSHSHEEETLPTPTPIATASPTPRITASPTRKETVTPVPAALASEAPVWQFNDDSKRFWTEGALWLSSGEYRSPTLSLTVDTVIDTETFNRRITYYVADIYVRDVTQIKTAHCRNNFKNTGHGDVERMCRQNNALVAISGDYCGFHRDSLVIRNGEVYRKTMHNDQDICLLLRDGTMETIRFRDAKIGDILEKDPWQAWQFGPALLNAEGDAYTAFPDSNLNNRNPRCCIGYVDPGHYKFVVVDGRQKQSRGLTLRELAQLMETLGCRQAFNLDGGASAHFYWQDTIFNAPSNGGGREMSDIIYLEKEEYPASVYFHGKDGI